LRLIDTETLKRIAKTKGINNIGFAEKDYFQDIILLGVSREVPNLVFKGGTALYKTFGLERFSEDLDFSGTINEVNVKRIARYVTDFGYDTDVSINQAQTGTLLTFVTRGFLFSGRPESYARVQMDVNEVSVELEANWYRFFSIYPDIPRFRIKVMAFAEIAAEKVRALLVRSKARDMYDVWFLICKGVEIDQKLINKKLELYQLSLNKTLINSVFDKCEQVWRKELTPILDEVPQFDEVKEVLLKALV
jgi:predicted nucleotidyltransferase component of viral defense system